MIKSGASRLTCSMRCHYAPHFRRNDVQSLARYSIWSEGKEKARLNLDTLRADAARLQNDPAAATGIQLTIGFIIGSLWPFVVVLALAFKFAKGVEL